LTISKLFFFPDEWVLVTAAAGGVGIAAVQIAKGMVLKKETQPQKQIS